MPVPHLTPEQRAAASAKAVANRVVRAKVKAELKAGQTSLANVIAVGQTDEVIGSIKVSALLESIPGIGKVRSAALMNALGIASSRRIRGLGQHQRDKLIFAIAQAK